MKPVVIAIDGPSASGKSTVARRVAERLGYVYVDSGSFYRGITWKAVSCGVAPSDLPAVKALLGRLDLRLFLENKAVRFTVDGINPGEELRSASTVASVSEFAAVPEVRAAVVGWLRQTVKFGNLVVEGRDIGSVVFPDAAAKFYIDASPEERARRRYAEDAARRQAADLQSVRKIIDKRDRIDSTRQVAPLTVPVGAVTLDTTGMSIDDVVNAVLSRVSAQKDVECRPNTM